LNIKKLFGSRASSEVNLLETLVLKEEDVKKVLNMNEVLDVVEQVFKEKALGRVQMPPKMYVYFESFNGDLRVMPSYVETFGISAVKVVNVHPDNRRFNLPTVMATITLVDPKTGAPLAIMGGTWITAMRTGAASGVAAKHLSRKGSSKLALIGAGVQAVTQMMAMAQVMKLEEVAVYDIADDVKTNFVNRMSSEYPDIKISAAKSIQEAVEDVDVVVTLTPSRKPIVKNDWIKSGTHIGAIGADAPGKEELDPAILQRAKIIVDDLEQSRHSGEINVPLEKGIISMKKIYGELGEIIARKKVGRTSNEEITIFDSTGLAIQDAVTAKLAYEKALKAGLGIKLSLAI